MRFIRKFIQRLTGLFGAKNGCLGKKSLRSIDLTDLLTEDFKNPAGLVITKDDFKAFSSTDDYNREFLAVFQSFKQSFFLDYNQRDGHFRV